MISKTWTTSFKMKYNCLIELIRIEFTHGSFDPTDDPDPGGVGVSAAIGQRRVRTGRWFGRRRWTCCRHYVTSTEDEWCRTLDACRAKIRTANLQLCAKFPPMRNNSNLGSIKRDFFHDSSSLEILWAVMVVFEMMKHIFEKFITCFHFWRNWAFNSKFAVSFLSEILSRWFSLKDIHTFFLNPKS